MMRGYSNTKGYYRYVIPSSKNYQINAIPSPCLQEPESAECRFIQQKKDELLVSLTKYFAKEIEKSEVEAELTNIKRDLVNKCPSYVPRPGCC
jgi:hypothetical protein